MSAQKTSTAENADSASKNWERLTDRVEQLRKDFAEVSNVASDLARAGASEGRDHILSEIDEMAQRLKSLAAEVDARGSAAARRAGAQASALGQEIENTINRNPLASVLVALGLGFVIGMASRGRR